MPIGLIALILLLVSCTVATADIYRYVNEEGVACFTDTPRTGSAVRIMKEEPAPPRRSPVKKGRSDRQAPELAGTNTQCPGGTLPVSGRISSPMGLRHDPIDGTLRDHKGVDIATPEGTPVRPVAPGVVVFSGYRPGYGNTVMVRHDDGMLTIYAHNSTNLKVKGDPVDRDSTIAFSGSTGRTTGPHLHFEAWRDGANITSTFIPAGASGTPHQSGDTIRRYVQADGTLVFTNLP